jgi:hypothetical protein
MNVYRGMLERIRSLASALKIRITAHTRSEMDHDAISTDELLAAMTSTQCEMVEDYPEDKRGHSHSILGRLSSGPVHICCSIHDEDVVIITVYRPDAGKWTDDWKTRL